MNRFKYYTPDGVTDILPGEVSVKKELENRLRELFKLNGYSEIETAPIEFYDVFAAGEGLVPQEEMFKFFDNSGRILALRYDGTIPVARVVSTHLKDEKLPLQLFYIADMFRLNEGGGGKQRVFTQAGIELIGAYGPRADAQIIEIAVNSAFTLGITDLQVSIGNVEFFKGLVMEWNLKDEEASKLQSLIENKDMLGIRSFCKNNNLPEGSQSLLTDMLYSDGNLSYLDKMYSGVTNERSKKALDELKEVFNILRDCNLEKYISFDLGMIQSLNYYTGIIFKGFTYGLGFPLFSGGRYDNLAGKFGASFGATGFSLGVNLGMKALRRQGKSSEVKSPEVIVGYGGSGACRKKAFDYARKIKGEGRYVITDCTVETENDLKKLADDKGIPEYKFFE